MSRIMIVDDDHDILKFCKTILSGNKHEVITCANPLNALDALLSHDVDLLVVDVLMPEMNGYDFLKTLKAIKSFNCPVMMLTRKNTAEDVKTALQLGAVEYMVKPIDRDVFLSKVNTLLATNTQASEVKFAPATIVERAEVSLDATIVSVTEMGLILRTHTQLDRNSKVTMNTEVFKEIGIQCPPLRVANCRALENDSEYKYELFIGFIGLDELSMQKIRRWITSRAIKMRKAG